MLEITKYIPEILDEISTAKTRDTKKDLIVNSKNNNSFITMIMFAYGDKLCRLSKGDIKRLLAVKYKEQKVIDYDMTFSNLFVEYKKMPFFFDGGVLLKQKKLEQIFLQLREVIHPKEFDVFVKVLQKKNLAKGMTEKLIRETFPKLLPLKE